MKYIFLDVDGVLNSSRSALVTKTKGLTYRETMVAGIDPIAAKLVNRLAEEADAKIVISSSHKTDFLMPDTTHFYGGTTNSNGGISRDSVDLFRLGIYFQSLGIDHTRIVGATPDILSQGRIRGDEIERWFTINGIDPEADRYVILDDINSFHRWQPVVLVDGNEGFSFKNYRQAEIELGLSVDMKPRIILPPK